MCWQKTGSRILAQLVANTRPIEVVLRPPERTHSGGEFLRPDTVPSAPSRTSGLTGQLLISRVVSMGRRNTSSNSLARVPRAKLVRDR